MGPSRNRGDLLKVAPLISGLPEVFSGITVAVVAFVLTKCALGIFGSAPSTSPQPVLNIPTFTSSNFTWIGMRGLDTRLTGGTPAINGAPILRMVATGEAGRHYLAGESRDLDKNHVYRIGLWVKPEAGGNLKIEAGDHASPGASYGVGIFDLTHHRAAGMAAAKPGITLQADHWQRVWVELPTSNGLLFFALYVLKGQNDYFAGNGKMAISLGGVSVEPQG